MAYRLWQQSIALYTVAGGSFVAGITVYRSHCSPSGRSTVLSSLLPPVPGRGQNVLCETPVGISTDEQGTRLQPTRQELQKTTPCIYLSKISNRNQLDWDGVELSDVHTAAVKVRRTCCIRINGICGLEDNPLPGHARMMKANKKEHQRSRSSCTSRRIPQTVHALPCTC